MSHRQTSEQENHQRQKGTLHHDRQLTKETAILKPYAADRAAKHVKPRPTETSGGQIRSCGHSTGSHPNRRGRRRPASTRETATPPRPAPAERAAQQQRGHRTWAQTDWLCAVEEPRQTCENCSHSVLQLQRNQPEVNTTKTGGTFSNTWQSNKMLINNP